MKHSSSRRHLRHKYDKIVDTLYNYSTRSCAEQSLASAVITRNGDILTMAENDCMQCIVSKNIKHQKKQIRVVPPLHAEEKALTKLRKTKKHVELKYGTRYLKSALIMIVVRHGKNNPILAKPCKNCFLEMIKCGISRVYYTNNNGELESIRCSICELDDFSESGLRRSISSDNLTVDSVLRHIVGIKGLNTETRKQFEGCIIVISGSKQKIICH